ncbi:MAG TPA: hypothetical protein VG758_33240 [Hyphomicrobiaceae bacterium]|nr:hypothetical protein [Hyphomicrobiaceae bacterium]
MTEERRPAYVITEAELRLVEELYKAGKKEAARDVVDFLMEKRWPDVPDRVEPPNLVHLSAYRRKESGE